MNCPDLEQPETMVDFIRIADDYSKNNIYRCFKKFFYEYCINYSTKSIFIRYSFYPANKIELLDDSFVDAFVGFYLYVNKKGFENKAAVRTAFYTFYKRALWKNIERLNKYNAGLFSGDPEIQFNNKTTMATEDDQEKKEKKIERENQYASFEKAFQKLGERCQNLIRWRKIEKLSIEEIAQKSGIKVNVVANEIYRCINKLKDNIDGLP